MEICQLIEQKWARKEMELNQKHKDILAEREKLLSDHKIMFHNREKMVHFNACSLQRVRLRKRTLKKEIELFEIEMKNPNSSNSGDSKLDNLKSQYWQMITWELSSL